MECGRIGIALTMALLCGCYESATPTPRYERSTHRADYGGAEADCRARGGTLATERGNGSLSAILAACSEGLPSDLTPCWTAIPVDREGPALVLMVAPKQPVFSGFDVDAAFDATQGGYYAVCEIP